MQHFIIATAGHVDHGKSSLVKALTGTDPDRLPEEKARGITIELGFAHLELPNPSGGEPFRLGIVDVPGHEDFVKNMVAGVGAIDLALLVVAADDGWMPQTEEHLQILEYLGVARGVVALTKSDLASRPIDQIVAEMRDHLVGSALAAAPIIPTALPARGFSELKVSLAKTLSGAPPPADNAKPRLPIDRAFALRGIGTVVTGTLSGGRLHRGQEVLLQPLGLRARIRAIQSHSAEIEEALPGSRTALNLPEFQVAAPGQSGVRRGLVITSLNLDRTTTIVDALLWKSHRATGEKGPARPIKDGMIARFHQGTANHSVRILLYESKTLRTGEETLVQLRFEEPVFVLSGERFIIRDWAEQSTIGGGTVLDAEAIAENFRAPAQLEFLKARAAAPASSDAAVEALVRRDKAIPRHQLLATSTFAATEIEAACTRLSTAGRTLHVGEFAVEVSWWKNLQQKAAEVIDLEHKSHPEKNGLAVPALRNLLPEFEPHFGLFDHFMTQLRASGFQQSSGLIRRAQHRQLLPPQLSAAGEKIRHTLLTTELDPPSRKTLAPDPASQQALRFLIDTREVIDLGPDLAIGVVSYRLAAQLVRDYLARHLRATAGELRQHLGVSRRVIIPLLERLDKDGITRREGDTRVLRT